MLRSLSVLAVSAASASASPYSIAPGGQDPDSEDAGYAQKSVDFHAAIDYAFELDSSSLVRERLGPGTDPLGGVPTIRDLAFNQSRHVLTPHVQLGVFRNAFLSVALPIIISQVRELSLGEGVDRAGSTAVTDGLLPATGFDANDPGTPTPGELMFRGPTRSGIDQLHLGLGFALMSQALDRTKPTWKLGGEVRVAIGKTMAFDPVTPDANTAVGRGVHEVKVYTSFARKLGWAEPWFELFWIAPLTANSSSLFQDPGFGASNLKPSQLGGVNMGVELYVIDNKADQNRVSLDVGAKAIAHFEGREYTEMWEVFAFAGESRGMGPLILDADPTRIDVQPLSHPGITNIENYLETRGKLAIRAQIGPHVRFAVSGELVWKSDHLITFADAGVDLPTCDGSGGTCENEENDLVNPGTDEVNPLHVQAIDLVGHRYRSEDNFGVVFGVHGQVLF